MKLLSHNATKVKTPKRKDFFKSIFSEKYNTFKIYFDEKQKTFFEKTLLHYKAYALLNVRIYSPINGLYLDCNISTSLKHDCYITPGSLITLIS